MLSRLASESPPSTERRNHVSRTLWRALVALVTGSLIALLSVAVTPTRHASAEPFAVDGGRPWGPIRTGVQHPFALLHLTPEPRAPRVLTKGAFEGRGAFIWSNTANREKRDYRVDAETRVLDLHGAYGLTETLQLDVALPVIYRGGGFTDQMLDEYHRVLGLPRGPRGRLPYDDFRMEGFTDDGGTFRFDETGTGFGTAAVGLTADLTPLSVPRAPVALSLELGLPTGSDELGQDSVDLRATLSGAYAPTARPVLLFGGISSVVLGDRFESGVDYPEAIHGFYLGAEADLIPGSLSLVASALATTEIVENVRRFPIYGVYLDVGLRYWRREGIAYELSVRENPGPDAGTTDISILLGLTLHFEREQPTFP